MARKPTRPAYGWVRATPKPKTSAKIDTELKEEVTPRAQALIDELRPIYIQTYKKPPEVNYLSDLYLTWKGATLFFCGRYECPGPHAMAPFFETRFARMKYVGNKRFDLSWMRYTGAWHVAGTNLTADECLHQIRTQPYLQP